MKILHLRATSFFGGPERQLLNHARHVDRYGVEITIGSFTEQGQCPEILTRAEGEGIPTQLFEVTSPYDLRSPGMIRRFLAENQFDILCTHDYRTQFLGWLATRRPKTAWLAFSRGWTHENLKIRFYNGLDKTVIRLADHLVAVSEAQKQRLVRLWVPAGKISTVHNAIDLKRVAETEPVDLRERFGLEPDSLVVVAGGRFSREKGQLDLIRAAAIASGRNPRLRFVLFGDGPDLETMRQLVTELGLEDKVLLPGFERNLWGCLKTADILINPSHTEGLPNIVLEAMAVGLPVLATAVGGVPELIEDDHNGRLIPSKEPEAIATALETMATDDKLRDRYAANARTTITDNFGFDSQAKKLYQVYQRLMER